MRESGLMRSLYLAFCAVLVLVWIATANAQSQTAKQKFVKAHSNEVEQPYTEYRGVSLGMTMDEARKKLGEPVSKDNDQDFYVLSENETTQIVYDATHRVKTISTDYMKGVGAPDHRTVVGNDLQQRADGSTYKMLVYEKEGFWVSYFKSAGAVVVVTITIQLLPR